MKKLVLMMMCICFVSVLTGCETIKGLGQDIENTGNNVWDAINK